MGEKVETTIPAELELVDYYKIQKSTHFSLYRF